MSELKTIGSFKLLPPAKDVCQQCAVKHPPENPHNAQSLYYQYAFCADHQRWPNWIDAMAHCGEPMKEQWTKELTARGVDVAGGKVNPTK